MTATLSSPPFSVPRIDHVVIRVAVLDRAIEFYRALLGCEVVKRRDYFGLVHERVGASMIDLVWVDGPTGKRGGAAAGEEARNMDHFCLRIDPFDEAKSSCISFSTACRAAPTHRSISARKATARPSIS